MKRQRGILASIGAAATALLLAFGGASAAQAAPSSFPEAGATGSINIHKFEQPDAVGGESNGLERDTSSLTAIPGVTFTATPITGLDLTKNAGWQAASKLTLDAGTGKVTGKGTNGNPVQLGAPLAPQVTNAAGDATFADLPLGMYLVQETAAPAGVTKAAPFLVTVPLTDPEGLDSWIYDIHVYPKNSTVKATKTVADEGATKVGDAIAWTITGDLPRIATEDGSFAAPTGYRVVDALDPRLALAKTEVKLTSGPALVEGTDFTVTDNANTVTVNFLAPGLAKLGTAASDPAAKLQIVLTTTVISLEDGTVGDGKIKNTAVVFPNAESFDVKPGEPGGPVVTPEVESRWGDILINKVSTKDAGTKLAGAKFQVFTSAEAAKQAGTAAAKPVVINGEDTFTTLADGTVRISGLHVSDFVNGTEIKSEDNYRYYWIVEVEAPKDYELLAEPIRTTVTAGGTAVQSLTVENAPKNAGFELPLTGAAGTWMFTIAGLIVIGGGIALMLRRKKAERAA